MYIFVQLFLWPAAAALIGLLFVRMLPVSTSLRLIAGGLGIVTGIALECWLFGVISGDCRLGYGNGSVADSVFLIACYLSAFASGAMLSAVRVSISVLIVLAVGAGVIVGWVFAFAGIMNGAASSISC